MSLKIFVQSFFSKIYDFLFLLDRIFHRLICAAGIVLDITDHKIRTVDHTPVPDLHRGFEMRGVRFRTNLNFVVILGKAVFIVLKLGGVIW